LQVALARLAFLALVAQRASAFLASTASLEQTQAMCQRRKGRLKW
jgi:hypothetical protein